MKTKCEEHEDFTIGRLRPLSLQFLEWRLIKRVLEVQWRWGLFVDAVDLD